MSNKIKTALIIANLLLLLGYYNYAIYQKETILEDGTTILLALAPVDPRSLMQGDYMRLSYAITSEMNRDSIAARGYLVVILDSVGVAHQVRWQTATQPCGGDEVLVKYYSNDWDFNIGAESYFFEEGQADRYAVAKYGCLRVDDQGNSVLIGLCDERRQILE